MGRAGQQQHATVFNCRTAKFLDRLEAFVAGEGHAGRIGPAPAADAHQRAARMFALRDFVAIVGNASIHFDQSNMSSAGANFMSEVRLTVKLWVKDEAFMTFEKFENAAFKIMEAHGGKVLKIDQNHTASDGLPHEVHYLEFQSMAAFDAYKADPALALMADLRERCIAKTEVTVDGN
jgi:uncharacterized protein (DUF1330 family)